MLVKAVFLRFAHLYAIKRLLHAIVQQPFCYSSVSSVNSPGMPHRAARPTSVNTIRDQMEALPPSSQPTKSNWNKAPVDAAHDHQNQADFIKGLHKKDLLPLEPFCPMGRRFIHGQIRRPARRPCPAVRCTPASSGALPPQRRRGRMSHPGRCQTPPTHCRSSEPSQRPFHAAEP